MIYKHPGNPGITVVELGHGDVKVCPTDNSITKIANGEFFNSGDGQKHPIGTKHPQDKGKDCGEFSNGVLLLFQDIKALDLVIQDLLIVRKGMLEGKSVVEADEEGIY